jgi:hypothetical protein
MDLIDNLGVIVTNAIKPFQLTFRAVSDKGIRQFSSLNFFANFEIWKPCYDFMPIEHLNVLINPVNLLPTVKMATILFSLCYCQ